MRVVTGEAHCYCNNRNNIVCVIRYNTYGVLRRFLTAFYFRRSVSEAISVSVDFNCYNSEHKQGYPLNEDVYKIRYG